MHSDYEKRLEQQIDGLLKGLPALEAPAGLVARVMARTVRKQKAPWHKQSWEMWPAGLRYAALALLLGSFGALCFASWQLTRAAGFANAMQEVTHAFSGVSVLWNALATVVSGLVLALKQIHPAILVGCLSLLAIGWSACVALGTAFVRFTLVRK